MDRLDSHGYFCQLLLLQAASRSAPPSSAGGAIVDQAAE
jgi:hypothetical protein